MSGLPSRLRGATQLGLSEETGHVRPYVQARTAREDRDRAGRRGGCVAALGGQTVRGFAGDGEHDLAAMARGESRAARAWRLFGAAPPGSEVVSVGAGSAARAADPPGAGPNELGADASCGDHRPASLDDVEGAQAPWLFAAATQPEARAAA